MKQNLRRVAYLVAAIILLGVLAAGPRAWAIPPFDRANQTVPTRTPTRSFVPTEALPATPVAPGPATPEPSAVTPAPQATTPGAAPGVSPALSLVKVARRQEAWPGATVIFTLTLTNTGGASARQVALEDTLPTGLMPGQVLSAGAGWEGRTLRARAPVLPPGGRLVVVFTAVMDVEAGEAGVIVNRATATAAGGLTAAASAFVVLPPAELPPTGGGGSSGRPW